MSSRIIKLFLFLVGLSLLSALIYRAGFREIIKIIAGARWYSAFFGVLVYLILIFTRSIKWYLLARFFKNEIKYKKFLPFYLVNSLMGNLTPFKSGEAVTPILFNKYLKIPVGQGFSIIILDRFFELIIFTAILVLAVFYILNQGIQNSLILPVFRGTLIMVFLLLVILITVLIAPKIILKIIRSLRIFKFIEKELDNFYNALSLFKNKKVYQFVIPLTLMGWFLEISAYYLTFGSVFSVSPPFIKVAAAQMVAAAVTFVAFIPGGMGAAEVSAVYILGLLNYPLAPVTGGVLLMRLILTGTLLITGLIGSVLIKGEEKHSV